MIARVHEGNLEVPKASQKPKWGHCCTLPRPATKSELLPTLSG